MNSIVTNNSFNPQKKFIRRNHQPPFPPQKSRDNGCVSAAITNCATTALYDIFRTILSNQSASKSAKVYREMARTLGSALTLHGRLPHQNVSSVSVMPPEEHVVLNSTVNQFY